MTKTIIPFFLIVVTLAIQSCNKEESTPPAPKPIAVGDFNNGGVVFYIDNSGEHGLVCTVQDQSFGTSWGCAPQVISGAMGTAIGTGAQNTSDILAVCNDNSIAAAICDNLILNGHSDWFLPSKDELNEMYSSKNKIDSTSLANGGAALQSINYWSSSLLNLNTVWIQTFASGGSQSGLSDSLSAHVRAVRAF